MKYVAHLSCAIPSIYVHVVPASETVNVPGGCHLYVCARYIPISLPVLDRLGGLYAFDVGITLFQDVRLERDFQIASTLAQTWSISSVGKSPR